MNYSDYNKTRSSLYILGKEFIIVVVVIFSALSFTLGYFVGKSGKDEKSEPFAEMTEITPSPQEKEILPEQPSTPEEIPQSAMQSKEYLKTEPQRTISPKKAKNPKTNLLQKGIEIIYTVQLGAFKNASDAENFKVKYENKGYKTYITVSQNMRNEKIYKIRTGEFKDRKDAEILSLKLKKSEGLNSFVTYKNK